MAMDEKKLDESSRKKSSGETTKGEHPETTGKYRINQVLGQGAMGVVYQGYDPHIERVVAIKVIKKDQVGDEDWENLQERFKREAIAAGRLQHPNIVTVHEYGEDDGSPYLVMEYVEGISLGQYMKKKGNLSIGEAVSIMKKLLSALEYSHSKGVIHRDIKPGNIFILENGDVKLSDFGIAKVETSDLTRPGMVLGTPAYMSPEQIQSEKTDSRSDLFSAGVVFYEMVTGKRPFGGSKLVTIIHNILNSQYNDPCSLNPDLSEQFRDVIKKALSQKPGNRYQSANEFLSALQEAVEKAPTVSFVSPPSSPQKGKKNFLPLALAILLLAGAAGAGVWLWSDKKPDIPPVAKTEAYKVETAEPKVDDNSSPSTSEVAASESETHESAAEPPISATGSENESQTELENASEDETFDLEIATIGSGESESGAGTIEMPVTAESKETESSSETASGEKAEVENKGAVEGQSPEEGAPSPETESEEQDASHPEETDSNEKPQDSEKEPSVGGLLQPGAVRITSHPKGADVYIDGKLIGTTPFEGIIDPGPHKLVLKKKGYAEIEDEFAIDEYAPGEPFVYDAELFRGFE